MIKNRSSFINSSIAFYTVTFIVLILAELLFYQFYYFVPITVNSKELNAKRGQTLQTFLTEKKIMPKFGRLLDVKGKVISNKGGNPPTIFVNKKRSNFTYSVEGNEEIFLQPGTDKTEKVVERVEEVQSKIASKGKGSFIAIIRKGRPGVRVLKKGQISGKVIAGNWLVRPQDYTIGRFNIRYRKVVALTFDDGPSKYTSLIMKILKHNKVNASFFVLGNNIKKRPKWLKEMAARHYTIGNHTYNHTSLNKISSKKIARELKMTDNLIHKITGLKTKWVRPPGGALNSSAINTILERGYRISMWNIDTVDWVRPSPKVIKARVITELKPGQVILMHDGGGNRMNTAAALPGIIKGIKKAGYRLVTLDELYRLVE